MPSSHRASSAVQTRWSHRTRPASSTHADGCWRATGVPRVCWQQHHGNVEPLVQTIWLRILDSHRTCNNTSSMSMLHEPLCIRHTFHTSSSPAQPCRAVWPASFWHVAWHVQHKHTTARAPHMCTYWACPALLQGRMGLRPDMLLPSILHLRLVSVVCQTNGREGPCAGGVPCEELHLFGTLAADNAHQWSPAAAVFRAPPEAPAAVPAGLLWRMQHGELYTQSLAVCPDCW